MALFTTRKWKEKGKWTQQTNKGISELNIESFGVQRKVSAAATAAAAYVRCVSICPTPALPFESRRYIIFFPFYVSLSLFHLTGSHRFEWTFPIPPMKWKPLAKSTKLFLALNPGDLYEWNIITCVLHKRRDDDTYTTADDDRNSFGRNERFYIAPSKRDTYVHTSKSDDFPCRFVTAHPLNTGVAVL